MVKAPLAVALIATAGVLYAPSASADDIGFIVNTTLGPGSHFANAEQALSYGYGICDKIGAGVSYAQIVRDARADLGELDEYQASYLIGQAADQLCPSLIWQLRQSAAGYRPSQ